MAYSSDLCIGGIVTASSTNGSQYPSNAFDDSVSTIWQASSTSSPQWIKYQLVSAKAVSKLRLRPDYDTGYLLIKNFKLYGSNDDSVYSLLLESATSSNTDQWYEFTFSNSTSYLYYKLEIIDHWYSPFSGYFAGAKEIEMMGKIPLLKSARATYNSRNGTTKKVVQRYSYPTSQSRSLMASYHSYQSSQKSILGFYFIAPPVVEIYSPSGDRLENVRLGLLNSGEVSKEVELHLWNNRLGNFKTLSMTEVFLSLSLVDRSFAGGLNEDGQEMLDAKWLELKSNGVSGSSIVDDVQALFTPVGGNPVASGLSVGVIPSGTARHIQLRINIPQQVATAHSIYPKFLITNRPSLTNGFGIDFGYNFGG